MNTTKYTVNDIIRAKLLNCAQRKVKKASIIMVEVPKTAFASTRAEFNVNCVYSFYPRLAPNENDVK